LVVKDQKKKRKIPNYVGLNGGVIFYRFFFLFFFFFLLSGLGS
jgi:hypothetical protein